MGLGDADLGVGRYEVLLGLADVGTPFEKIGRKPGGYGRQPQLIDRNCPVGRRAGIAAQERIQGVFLLGDGLLEGGDGGKRLLVFRLRLVQLELGDQPSLEAEREYPVGVLAGCTVRRAISSCRSRSRRFT